ncbi:MAG: hypothetical protein K2N29_00140 [Ruminiclostridium sp.]|nr:hypothetical protein [Ruminiclostridium sp.]
MIDPKLEEMLRHCRAYKKQIDRKRRLVRTAMLCPPVLIAFERIITFILTAFDTVGQEAETRSPVDMSSFLVALAISIFVAEETVIEKETRIEVSGPFYGIAAAACVLLSFFFPAGSSPLTVLALYCLIAVPLNILFKRLYEENLTLKRKKGYPHFDPRLISEKELREEKSTAPKPPEGLTPEEQLVWERDRNL